MKYIQNIKKYLPTKKFSIIIGVFILLTIVVLVILSFFNKKQSFTTQKENAGLENIEGKTLEQIINTDTDLDSVYDWEEALWGTDKNKIATFDMPDATYIANKKRELNIEDTTDDKKFTETEQFARNFFTSYTALKASGQVDDNAINDFSKSLGEKIINTTIENIYTLNNIKTTTATDKKAIQAYYDKLQIFFTKYEEKGIGNELEIINDGVVKYNTDGKETNYDELFAISKAYKDFAVSVVSTQAPESVREISLRIANEANNTGESILNLQKTLKDPIVGLSGLSQYQDHSKAFISAVEELESYIE
ncbi:MAG: hypothetical protein M3P22_01840 [bacterium]|nr:hypothetical protein [bacterium]